MYKIIINCCKNNLERSTAPNIHLAKNIAQRILSVFLEAFNIATNSIYCSASLGISMYPLNGESGEALVKFADIAMYRAKNLGRNQACVFQDSMHTDFLRKYQIELELRKALKENEFTLYFQPIISTDKERIEGIEALIRWPTAVTSNKPDEFIDIAE